VQSTHEKHSTHGYRWVHAYLVQLLQGDADAFSFMLKKLRCTANNGRKKLQPYMYIGCKNLNFF